jgi:hypothetical protein
MILNNPNQTLQVVLSSPKGASDCPVVVEYADLQGGGESDVTQLSTTNGVSPVTCLSAPATYRRRVREMSVYNQDSGVVVVTVSQVDSTQSPNTFQIIQGTLNPGESLLYSVSQGWKWGSSLQNIEQILRMAVT